MQIEVVADYQDTCGEGPLWDDRSRILYWVDATGQKIHRRDMSSGAVKTVDPGVPVSAVALTDDGQLVAAGAAGIWLLQDDEPLLLAARHENKLLGINDSIADPHGRLLAGSTFFNGTDSYPYGYLYRLDHDGSIHVLDDGYRLANGMGFSPDNTILYVTDSAARRIYSYEYSVADGTATNRRLFVQVPQEQGLPDGLTVDSEGFVWSAQWFGACVCRYDPDGSLERRLPVPADQTSSVAFGGDEMETLFITSAAKPDAEVLAPPERSGCSNVGGQLFCLKPGVTGKPEFRVRVPVLK